MASVKDFSVEEKLLNLVKLQKTDSKLDQIQVLRGELPMEVSDLEDEILGLLKEATVWIYRRTPAIRPAALSGSAMCLSIGMLIVSNGQRWVR